MVTDSGGSRTVSHASTGTCGTTVDGEQRQSYAVEAVEQLHLLADTLDVLGGR